MSGFRVKLLAVSLSIFLANPACAFAKSREKAWDQGLIEFRSKCALCHGEDGKGHGRFASRLKTEPADLTQLARENGGVFPREEVLEVLDGRKAVEDHGPRDMPVWGGKFMRGAGWKTRLDALLDYLARIQAK